MSEEIEELRAEIAKLKKDVGHLLHCLNQADWEDGSGEPFPEFEGQKVYIRDNMKVIPLLITATPDGADLCIYDKNSKLRARLGMGTESAWLEFFNAQGKLVIQLGEGEDGSGQICVCDPEGNGRAGMKVSRLGGTVSVTNKQGMPLVGVVGSENGGEVFVFNNQLNTGVKLAGRDDGGVVTVHEPSGEVMAFLAANNGFGCVNINGHLGMPALTLAANPVGGFAMFYDGDGKSTHMLPLNLPDGGTPL